ncbi:MAG: hypothetical protein ACREX9_11630 [Gammaproteobacteria bacterium]
MASFTIRMPDHVHERLTQLARSRKLTINKLMEELSIAALAELDAETRFRVRAARNWTALAGEAGRPDDVYVNAKQLCKPDPGALGLLTRCLRFEKPAIGPPMPVPLNHGYCFGLAIQSHS